MRYVEDTGSSCREMRAGVALTGERVLMLVPPLSNNDVRHRRRASARFGRRRARAVRLGGRTMSEAEEREEEPATDHLDDVADGCGCTEIWEHLSEQRDD
ncbi:hypothetical protein GCM10008985_24030 [Halococcus dombrowskii]|uniref:Uncharacterized protein n=1 Tax=Halococcus dombrowskii TaxID=179637 RepID=A0AAV3SH71_HALDO